MRVFKTLSILLLIILLTSESVRGQEDYRAMTLDEYELAKSFEIEDLDNDTYVKFENKYILDRYELKKPIFITGDDGFRKRVDLYHLMAREGLMNLGVMVFYTTETGIMYKALIPNYISDGEVWESYFEDIHAIDKVEENFVLKLSYVISRELSFQIFKNTNEVELDEEHATYGSDICFPGDQLVSLENGVTKYLSEIEIGDKVVTIDPLTKATTVVEVNKLVSHTPENYAISVITLVKESYSETDSNIEISLSVKELKATPNHPMRTKNSEKTIGEVIIGEEIVSWNEQTQSYDTYTVFSTKEITEGVQPVYSIEANGGTTLLMNGVMVKQKN